MKAALRQTTEAEAPHVASLLATAFRNEPDAAPVTDDALRWKNWAPHPLLPPSRGYVLEKNDEWQAHLSLWPFPLEWLTGRAGLGVHAIDWAGSPSAPGAGVTLMRRVTALADVLIAVGGSPDTRKVLPLAGFREVGAVDFFALPLRTVRHVLRHPRRNWKLPARLLRNLAIRGRARGRGARGWSAAPVPSGAPGPMRDAAWLEYLRACPEADVRLFAAVGPDGRAGGFLLSETRRQVRVAAAWFEGARRQSAEDFSALYRLCARHALAFADADELVAAASLPERADGLRAAGFRWIQRLPIMVYRAAAAPGACEEPWDYQMAMSDAFYLHGQSVDYWL